MSTRDDMVFRPNLGPLRMPSIRARAKTARVVRNAEEPGGSLHRLGRVTKFAVAQKVARSKLGSAASRSIATGAARQATGMLGRTPVGLILGTLAVAGIVGARLVSGKPLEGLGAEINRMVLGDMDDSARAKKAIRERVRSDPALGAYIQYASKGDRIPDDVADWAMRQYEREFRRQRGQSKLMERMPVDNTLDLLILRIRDIIVRVWNELGMPELIDRVRGILAVVRYTAKAAAAPFVGISWASIGAALGREVMGL